jgi:hypothetical protein
MSILCPLLHDVDFSKRKDGERGTLQRKNIECSAKDLETLSEHVGPLRNHFYDHAFSDGSLLKGAEVRKIVEKLLRSAELHNTR